MKSMFSYLSALPFPIDFPEPSVAMVPFLSNCQLERLLIAHFGDRFPLCSSLSTDSLLSLCISYSCFIVFTSLLPITRGVVSLPPPRYGRLCRS